MVADAHGAEVFVLKGEVEAAPRASPGGETILLREKESRRFAATGVSDVSDSVRKFARFAEPLQFSRLTLATRLVHWSFDEADGDVFRAEVSGARAEDSDARLQLSTMTERAAVRAEGRRGVAVRFDGRTYVRARVPGISGTAPHTVSFWVRVPEDAPLSDAYSMITWATNNKKLGNRHVGINWNRDRTEGHWVCCGRILAVGMPSDRPHCGTGGGITSRCVFRLVTTTRIRPCRCGSMWTDLWRAAR